MRPREEVAWTVDCIAMMCAAQGGTSKFVMPKYFIGEQSRSPVQRSPRLGRFTTMTDPVWLWVVYRVDSAAVFGAVRRAESLYTTAEEARSAVEREADRMDAGEIRWDQTDETTWVARTAKYVCVVWSIRLPE
jgi:hypothetical protein